MEGRKDMNWRGTSERRENYIENNSVLSSLTGRERGKYELLVLFAVAIHFIDAVFFRLEFNGTTFFVRLLMYAALSMAAYYTMKENGNITEYFIASAIPVFIPAVLTLILRLVNISGDITKYVNMVILIIPTWLIYLLYMKQIDVDWQTFFPIWPIPNVKDFTSFIKIGRLWIGFISVMVIISLINVTAIQAAAIPGIQGPGVGVVDGWNTFTTFVSETYITTADKIKNAGKIIDDRWQKYYNETLGAYYTGQVEQNKEVTGIFIKEFKPLGKYYEDIPVDLSALVKVRSFSNDVAITFSCEAKKEGTKDHIINGTTDPENPVEFFRDDQKVVFCRFERDQLAKGRYKVTINADFKFETWAYTTYTFLDRDFMTSALSKGEDLNSKLDMPRNPKTIYTAGPVTLGMNEQLDMPLGLNSNSNTKIPIGITVENSNGRGKVRSVDDVQFRMPAEFVLEPRDKACTKPVTNSEPDQAVPGYIIYSFRNDRPELLETYQTISCYATVNPADAARLLGQAGKARISITGIANYSYRLTESATIDVKATI